jgi:hypothetical protein
VWPERDAFQCRVLFFTMYEARKTEIDPNPRPWRLRKKGMYYYGVSLLSLLNLLAWRHSLRGWPSLGLDLVPVLPSLESDLGRALWQVLFPCWLALSWPSKWVLAWAGIVCSLTLACRGRWRIHTEWTRNWGRERKGNTQSIKYSYIFVSQIKRNAWLSC